MNEVRWSGGVSYTPGLSLADCLRTACERITNYKHISDVRLFETSDDLLSVDCNFATSLRRLVKPLTLAIGLAFAFESLCIVWFVVIHAGSDIRQYLFEILAIIGTILAITPGFCRLANKLDLGNNDAPED